MFSRWMYCQTSSSVQLESGKTRMLSPLLILPVEQVPQLRPLVLRVPLVHAVAEAVDALLGPALLLVAAGAAERRVELVVVQRLLQRRRLHDVGVLLRAVVERIDVLGLPLLVDPDLQIEALFAAEPIAELDHRPELPGRIDVQQRERQPAGVERLLRQPQHDGGVLADRIEHHRPLELGGDLADDVDALGFEDFQVGQVVTAAGHPCSCLPLSYRSAFWLTTDVGLGCKKTRRGRSFDQRHEMLRVDGSLARRVENTHHTSCVPANAPHGKGFDLRNDAVPDFA